MNSPWATSNRTSVHSPVQFFLDVPKAQPNKKDIANYEFKYYPPLKLENMSILRHEIKNKTRRAKMSRSLQTSPRIT